MAIIPSILINYKSGFMSAEKIDEKAVAGIQNQLSAAKQAGATKYPVILNISGAIVKYSNYNYWGTQSIIRAVRQLDSMDEVSGVLFNIDSGGGMVSGTAELTAAIKDMAKPTIAFTNGYMCSAALQIASGANMRISSPYADLIGSIGTMMSYQDFEAMFENWGAKIYEVYAPQSTEKNFEWRQLMSGDPKAYEKWLEELAGDFISLMKTNISGIKDDGHVFKGKTYTPAGALEVGLIDEICSLDEALSKF